MKLLKLIITLMMLLVACGERPLPNQDLILAYEFIKKGEFDTAKAIADAAPRLTDADSAMYILVRGAAAGADMDYSYNDSLAIEKIINFYDGDNEKSAWAHYIKSTWLFRFDSWESSVVEVRTAEKLAENTDCNELKFLICYQLAICNINSYNFDFYDEAINQLPQYIVTVGNKANYYYLKSCGYDIGRLSIDSARYYAKKAVECIEKEPVKKTIHVFYYHEFAELICDEDDSIAEKWIKKSMEIDTLRQTYSVLGKIYLNAAT